MREPPDWRTPWPWREPHAPTLHQNRAGTGSRRGGSNGGTTLETAFSLTSAEARATTPHEDSGNNDDDVSGAGGTSTSVERYQEVMRAAVDDFFADSTEEKVYVLTLKGNYRHKLLLEGIEQDYKSCTPTQKILAAVLKESGLLERWPPTEQIGRPPWAGGAVLYLTSAAVKSFDWGDEALRNEVLGVTLQSKHAVCSCRFFKILQDALDDKTPALKFAKNPREEFHIRRAGVISEKVLRSLPLPNAATH